jgi:hypothetical protein
MNKQSLNTKSSLQGLNQFVFLRLNQLGFLQSEGKRKSLLTLKKKTYIQDSFRVLDWSCGSGKCEREKKKTRAQQKKKKRREFTIPKAHFTLEVKAEKTWGPTLSILGLLFGPKGLQIGLPNSMVSFFFFPSLGAINIKAIHKVQHLLVVTRGRLKRFFLVQP